MRYEIEVGGRARQVVVTRVGDGFAVSAGDRTWNVNAARIDAHTLSLIVDSVDGTGVVSDLTVVPDTTPGQVTVYVGASPVAVTVNGRRRSGRGDNRGSQRAGPERIVAPMPGKIVRVLVNAGDAVTARQPLVIVEAMKMENELRAGRDGTIAEVHAREGASVDAGALLVLIQ